MISHDAQLASPGEEQELEYKKQELRSIELAVVLRQEELSQLKRQLQEFEQIYEAMIASKYRKLDELEKSIQEYLRHQPDLIQEKLASHDLKQIYRNIAKEIHPDLAKSEDERAVRLELMVKANEAYSQLDKSGLEQVLKDWQERPESVRGDDYMSQVARISLTLNLRERSLADLQEEIKSLQETDLNILRKHVIRSTQEGKDLLREMSEKIEDNISDLCQKLKDLKVD